MIFHDIVRSKFPYFLNNITVKRINDVIKANIPKYSLPLRYLPLCFLYSMFPVQLLLGICATISYFPVLLSGYLT